MRHLVSTRPEFRAKKSSTAAQALTICLHQQCSDTQLSCSACCREMGGDHWILDNQEVRGAVWHARREGMTQALALHNPGNMLGFMPTTSPAGLSQS